MCMDLFEKIVIFLLKTLPQYVRTINGKIKKCDRPLNTTDVLYFIKQLNKNISQQTGVMIKTFMVPSGVLKYFSLNMDIADF